MLSLLIDQVQTDAEAKLSRCPNCGAELFPGTDCPVCGRPNDDQDE